MSPAEITTIKAAARLLIVDDHPPTLVLLTELLRGAFPSHALVTARTSAETVAACRDGMPLVVIMDIGLPDINGIDTARLIKALSPGVAIVMHSNHDHCAYQEESKAAGADAFVSKTQTYAELIPAIHQLLALPAAGCVPANP